MLTERDTALHGGQTRYLNQWVFGSLYLLTDLRRSRIATGCVCECCMFSDAVRSFGTSDDPQFVTLSAQHYKNVAHPKEIKTVLPIVKKEK